MEEDNNCATDASYVQRLINQQIISPGFTVMDTIQEQNNILNGSNEEDFKMDIGDYDNFAPSNEVKNSIVLASGDENDNDLKIAAPEVKITSEKKNLNFLNFGNENDYFTGGISYRKNKVSIFSPDRFIPKRDFDDWQTKFSLISDSVVETPTKKKENASENRDYHTYNHLLQNELFGSCAVDVRAQQPTSSSSVGKICSTPESPKNLFYFKRKIDSVENVETLPPYSSSPVGIKSQKILRSPRKATRKISRIPFKVLDAPDLQDDFYLNLVDWSSQNVLAVGLGNSVYLWSASTSQVTRLCDFLSDSNTVTSVGWNERGNYVAVGTHHGYVQIWDVANTKMVNKLTGHSARVGALAWNGETLCSGSRDRLILQRDIRSNSSIPERRLVGHRQEVCGLKWSPDNQYLASGGNDNRLYVWNHSSSVPIQSYSEHVAAVKAIAWSPHQHGLLASGGGTADRCIRFWNTLTGQGMQSVDTGSQVCNLAWSKHSSELVSTHGYSQNQILVWKYPTLTQVAKLTGHSYRVLYLAMSPDGESIVTGAGDETLRFWNVFSKARSQKECRGTLNLFSHIR